MNDRLHPFLETRDNLFQFIITEIELAITFAEMARDTDNQAKRSRNCDNALKAYKGALRLMQKCGLTSDQSKEAQPLLDKLNGMLSPLTEIPSDVPPFDS